MKKKKIPSFSSACIYSNAIRTRYSASHYYIVMEIEFFLSVEEFRIKREEKKTRIGFYYHNLHILQMF